MRLAAVPADALWVTYRLNYKNLGTGIVRNVVDEPLPSLVYGLRSPLLRGVAIQAWRLRADSVCFGRTIDANQSVPTPWDQEAMDTLCRAAQAMGLGSGGYWVLRGGVRRPHEVFSYVPGRGERSR